MNQLPDEFKRYFRDCNFDEVNDFNLEIRYPEYRNEFYKLCNKEYADGYLTRIKETFQWLKSQIK